LEASLGTKPSFVWRNIFNARELLQQGLLWRVGNGKSIKVWGKRWLPVPTSYSVQSLPGRLHESALVADLIDPDLKSWKLELLQEAFTVEEAKSISKIPLSPLLPMDVLTWRCTQDGKFLLWSAYHLGRELQDMRTGQCSNVGNDSVVWRALWKLRVPNQVKLFFLEGL
jgi:hypothetical protein